MNLGRPHQIHLHFCSLALLTHRSSLAWENSQHYASHHQLVSPWDDTQGTTTDVTDQNLVVLQIGWSKFPSQQWLIRSTTQIREVTHHQYGLSPVSPHTGNQWRLSKMSALFSARLQQKVLPLSSKVERADLNFNKPIVQFPALCNKISKETRPCTRVAAIKPAKMQGVSFKISIACTATCMPFQYSAFDAAKNVYKEWMAWYFNSWYACTQHPYFTVIFLPHLPVNSVCIS